MIDNKVVADVCDESEAMYEVPTSNIPFIQKMIDNNHVPENTTQTTAPNSAQDAGKGGATGWGGTHMPAAASPNKL